MTAPGLKARQEGLEAGDWPRWMGPLGNGTAPATRVFPTDGLVKLTLKWTLPLGRGYSSISLAAGRAYTLATQGADELLVAIDAGDGRELWRLRLDAAGRDAPSSTPAVDKDRVFAISPHGKLWAVSALNGRPLWSHDLRQAFDAAPISYGMSTSPLVVDDLVVVLVGGREAHNLVAFDKLSGETVWSVWHAARGSYASPSLIEIDGERQIVAPADDRLYAVRATDGSLLWSHDGLGSLDRLPLPLPGNRLFIARESNAIMLRLSRDHEGWRVEELWRTEALRNSYSPVVHRDGAIYGFGGRELTCLEAVSGEVRWRHSVGDASLILVDGHLVVLNAENGRLQIIAARQDRFEERASLQALANRYGAFSPPTFAGGTIFVRDSSEVVAVAVGDRAKARTE